MSKLLGLTDVTTTTPLDDGHLGSELAPNTPGGRGGVIEFAESR